MHKIFTSRYDSPFGALILGIYNNELCLCDWIYRKKREELDKKIQTSLKAEYVGESHELFAIVSQQLNEYFQGDRKSFDIPLLFTGTPFQQEVWKKLMTIPYGRTLSYQELATSLNKGLAIRAIASANGSNSLAIIIPCHRVIGSDGSLTGYAGGLTAKRNLLLLEGVKMPFQQLSLFT